MHDWNPFCRLLFSSNRRVWLSSSRTVVPPLLRWKYLRLTPLPLKIFVACSFVRSTFRSIFLLLSKQKMSTLALVYENPKTGLGSARYLYLAAKKAGLTVTLRQAQEFIAGNNVAQQFYTNSDAILTSYSREQHTFFFFFFLPLLISNDIFENNITLTKQSLHLLLF